MPEYRVIAHRRVHKLLRDLKEKSLRDSIVESIGKLADYPLTLREMDTEKIKGLEKTFRIRVGSFRLIFHVDDAEKTVYVTHAEARKKAYTKL